MFGDSLVVAPVIRERAKDTGLAAQTIWLPGGSWIEWYSGARFEGPRTVERSFSLEEIPIYAKAGSIVPMQPPMRRSDERPVDPLILTVFPGADGSTRVYEDQGDSVGYQKGECAWTPVRHRTDATGTRVIEVLPSEGTYQGMPAQRGYEILLRATLPPKQILVGGRAAALVDPDLRASQLEGPTSLTGPQWWFDGEAMTTHIAVPSTSVASAVEVRVTPAPPPSELAALVEGFPGLQRRLHDLHNLVNRGWPKAIPPDILLNLAQTGHRMTIWPAKAVDELTTLKKSLPALDAAIAAIVMAPEARTQANALLASIRQ